MIPHKKVTKPKGWHDNLTHMYLAIIVLFVTLFQIECPEHVPDVMEPRTEDSDNMYIRYCQAGMVYIDPSTISNFAEEIRISGNPITAVLNDTFAGKRDLGILSLPYNQIQTLELFAFRNLFALKELHLNDNKLSHLLNGLFDNIDPINPSLTHLHLQNNRLSSLSEGIFQKLTVLNYLDLRENPLIALSDQMREELKLIENPIIGIPEGKYIILYHITRLHIDQACYKSDSDLAVICRSSDICHTS